MAREYILMSDFHLGGDAALDECDFEHELIGVLQELAEKGKQGRDLELIIVGDTFGFWELTEQEGPEMLTHVISRHRELFQQFYETGRHIRITITPGNHDHDLACYPEFKPMLAEYNIMLEPEYAITRDCAGRKIWLEHGNQHDQHNRIERFGDPHAKPLGYFITERLVSAAGAKSRLGRNDWLRDIESVSPSENVPNWLLSNYFYREMNPLLRWLLVPFLLLTGVSLIVMVGTQLEALNVIPTRFFGNGLMYRPPLFGLVFRYFVVVNMTALFVALLVAIPVSILIRDFRRTLDRYELRFTRKQLRAKVARYLTAAREVFSRHPEVALFVYGHTHQTSLTEIDGRVVINTGTWLKRLKRIGSRLTLLPDVYYPSFRIGYFHVFEQDARIVVEYHGIPKTAPMHLTPVERLIAFGKSKVGAHVPKRFEITPPS